MAQWSPFHSWCCRLWSLYQEKKVLQADLECSLSTEDTLINVCEQMGSCSVPREESNRVEKQSPGWVSVSGTYFPWVIQLASLCFGFSIFPGMLPHPYTGFWRDWYFARCEVVRGKTRDTGECPYIRHECTREIKALSVALPAVILLFLSLYKAAKSAKLTIYTG